MKKTPLFLLIGLVFSFICLFYLEPSKAQSEPEAVGLFDFIGSEKSVNTQQIRSSVSVAAVREQPVRINFDNINFETVQKLGIPLLDGATYEASPRESESFTRFAKDGFTWRGKISGNYDWSGDVILTVKGQALSGLIYSPTAVYEIIPQANSEHLLVELDQSLYPPCAGAIPAPKPATGNNILERSAFNVALDNNFVQRQREFDSTHRMLDATSPDNGSLLDVLVVYTSNVRTALGGTAQTQAFIQQAIASTNTAYQNSVINPRLQLVNTLEVNYTEVGTLSAALTWVRNDPTVAAARNTARADLVAILIESGSDGCGLGYVMHSVGPGFAANAFSATVRNCAVGNLSFAHELGHNEGCEHNPENGSPPNVASYPYAYGHYVNGSFRTVMSYADPCSSGCTRVPYFSNPSITVNGFATGITDQRDNHRVINNTALTISQFRESGGGNPCAPTSITVGQTLNGTLNTSDCRYPTGSSWYSDAYSFTGTAGQQVAITMSSTSFNTWLALVDPNGVELVFDDNGGGVTDSRIPATSGFYTLPSTGTYTIQASSSLNDAIGSYTVSLTRPSPPNDNFVNAQAITGASGSVTGTNAGATKESLEPNPAGNIGGASIWYQWQAPASGTVTMTTVGSNFDTLLGVYTGSSVNALTHITSNDDDSTLGTLTSRVTFNAVGGTIYRIVVDGFNGETGNVTLNWNLAGSCAYSISPPSRSFTSASGTGSITVTAGAGCAWTASSNAAWLVITSGSSGTGNGTVAYSVSANTGALPRSGAITVSGQSFTGTHTVSQTQPSVQPTVTTTAATSIASTSATLNGLINPNNSATNGWFEWGTSSNLATFNSTPAQAMGPGGASLAINSILSNLNPTTTYYYRVAASNSLGTSRGAILSFTTPLPSMNVLWTNTVGVSVSGNTLTKTASSVWGNAGAVSAQSLTSGDGYMEFTASSNTDARLAGLSRGDTDQNWQDVDFGIDPANNGQIYIYEAGVARGVFGSYASGDRFKVAVEGGVVKYYKNGSLLYTSTVAPTYPLLVDSAIYSAGGSVANAVIAGLSLQSTLPPTENVSWANVIGAIASGNTLTKTASSIWGNSGASSTRAIASGDGYMEFTAGSNTDARLAGLSRGDTDQNWQDVDFGIDPANNGQVYIYEAGVARGVFGSYASGDRFKVAIEAGVVKYYRNGALLYTSTVAPTYPLLVDSALYNTGVTVSGVVIGGSSLQNVSTTTPTAQNVSWANIVGAIASGNTLTKTASSIWGNAGAVSAQSLTSGDGYMEFTATPNTDARLAGLSQGDTDQNWQDVDFGIDPANNGQIYIYEAGVARGVFGSYASGDRFKVAVEGGVVKYYRNGALLYTSTVAPTYPLLVDSAIYSTGGSVTNAVIAGSSLQIVPTTENVSWGNIIGATALGNTLTKTASSIWGNSGASSNRAISSGDGYMEFTATTNTEARLAGLSRGDTDQNWQDVDFGIDPANNGQIYIYEAGVARGVFGSYASGDRFKVAIEGGVVKYYKNGSLLYTSTVAPTYPLLVDTALYSTGVTISDAVIYGYLQSDTADMIPLNNADSSYAWAAGSAVPLNGFRSSDLYVAIAGYYDRKFGRKQTGAIATPLTFYLAKGTYGPNNASSAFQSNDGY